MAMEDMPISIQLISSLSGQCSGQCMVRLEKQSLTFSFPSALHGSGEPSGLAVILQS
jgi:hypothetical protein